MQNINWEMMTQFVFPEELGIVEEVVSVEVKPIWQQLETDESIRLVGIYHIAAVARFNPSELPQTSDGIYIDDIDFVEQNNGYFEYALPLEVDLPRDRVSCDCQPEICINDVNFLVFNGSNCTFKWEVDCQFEAAAEEPMYQFDPAAIEPKEVHFGYDAIFPEIPEVPDIPEVPEQLNIEKEPVGVKGQTSVEEVEVEVEVEAPVKMGAEIESESVNLKHALLESDFELMTGTVLDSSQLEELDVESMTKDKIIESNQYFPTDADDFYEDLTESYTLLNFSNKISRE